MKKISRFYPLAILLLLSVVFFLNGWVSEDAYINFRVIEQLFGGQGLVWNPGERVQVFTSPLWLLVTAASRLFSSHLYANVIVLSYVLFLGSLAFLWKLFESTFSWLACCSLLLISSSFFDYTTSGLEYPLIYFLLTVFVFLYLSGCRQHITRASLHRLVLVFALLLLTRHDLLMLCLPAFLYYLWRASREFRARELLLICIIYSAPFWLWTGFSLLYFGFPFPNTAYAKLGTGLEFVDLVREGLRYLLDLARWDSISAVVLLAAAGLGLTGRKPALAYLAVGIALSVLYVIYAGGDYMRGRFFAPAFLVAAVLVCYQLAPLLADRKAQAGWLLAWLMYAVFYYHTPIASDFNHRTKTWLEWAADWEASRSGIVDARGIHSAVSSLGFYFGRDPNEPFPGGPYPADARAANESGEPVIVYGAIGMFGYFIQPGTVVVDDMALADPLLSRLPVSSDWRVSHYPRTLPTGYLESLASGTNQIKDANLKEYYQHLVTITQGRQLFSLDRLKTIVLFNLGYFDYLLDAYVQAHPEIYRKAPRMMYLTD
ncbi:MAG: hypothetical protein R3F50_05220 [Gammaproteobacteria bacterium]